MPPALRIGRLAAVPRRPVPPITARLRASAGAAGPLAAGRSSAVLLYRPGGCSASRPDLPDRAAPMARYLLKADLAERPIRLRPVSAVGGLPLRPGDRSGASARAGRHRRRTGTAAPASPNARDVLRADRPCCTRQPREDALPRRRLVSASGVALAVTVAGGLFRGAGATSRHLAGRDAAATPSAKGLRAVAGTRTRPYPRHHLSTSVPAGGAGATQHWGNNAPARGLVLRGSSARHPRRTGFSRCPPCGRGSYGRRVAQPRLGLGSAGPCTRRAARSPAGLGSCPPPARRRRGAARRHPSATYLRPARQRHSTGSLVLSTRAHRAVASP